MTQTKFICNPKRFHDTCQSEAIEVNEIYAVHPECMIVTLTTRRDYNEGIHGSNIAVAAFTTSYARLKILAMMEKLRDRLLYFDTDLIIFAKCRGSREPPIGNILGDWDNQLEDDISHIVRFVSCGPKVYSNENHTGQFKTKIKGVIQNGITINIVDWEQVSNRAPPQ